MPKGVYIRTDFHNKINSLSHLGITPWNKGLTGVQISWMKGKTHSEKSIMKMRESIKKSIDNGHIPWNKGNGVYKRDKDGIRLTRSKLAGKLSRRTVQLIYEDNIKKYGTLTCYLCELQIEFGQDSLEHKTPISRGGKNLYENLEVAHRKCNSKKYNKTVEEYKKASSFATENDGCKIGAN